MDSDIPSITRFLFLCLRFSRAQRGICAKDQMEDTGTVSGGNSSGPTSFTDSSLTWSDASPASTPDAQSTTPPAAEQPGTEQAASPQTTEDERSPFIPRARFDEINTRLKERETALSDWQQYAWAKQIQPGEFQQLHSIAKHFAGGDAVAGVQSLLAELRKDPQINAALNSLAAKQLAALRNQPHEPDANAEPKYLVQQADGSVVFDPNAHTQWQQWFQRQLLSQVEQKFEPVTKTIGDLQAEKAAAQQAQAVESFTNTTLADLKTWPLMDDDANLKLVGEELAKAQVDPNDARAIQLAVHTIYRTHIVPKLSAKSESSLLETLQRKAAASTSVNPASAAASAPGKVTSFYDRSLQW